MLNIFFVLIKLEREYFFVKNGIQTRILRLKIKNIESNSILFINIDEKILFL